MVPHLNHLGISHQFLATARLGVYPSGLLPWHIISLLVVSLEVAVRVLVQLKDLKYPVFQLEINLFAFCAVKLLIGHEYQLGNYLLIHLNYVLYLSKPSLH